MQIQAPYAQPTRPQRDWTLVYVLDGDNDLREAATLDLVELNAQGTPDNTAVIAQLYRGDLRWNFANFRKKVDALFRPGLPSGVAQDWRGMKVFEVRGQESQGASKELSYEPSSPHPSPSDPAELEKLLTYAMDKYPSKHFGVVLSGHGSQEGLLSDSSSRKMPFEDISAALRGASKQAGREVDLVLFDSCSTAGPAAAEAMQGVTRFLVASSEPIKSGGWSEKETMTFLADNPSATPEQLARSLVSARHSAVEKPVLYEF